MPCVSTLTTPFWYVKRSGRTSATKLTGSWRKIPERSQIIIPKATSIIDYICSDHNLRHRSGMKNYHGHHQILHASPGRICISHSRREHTFLEILSVEGDQHLKSEHSVQLMVYDLEQKKMTQDSPEIETILDYNPTCELDLGCNVYSDNNNICTRGKHNVCGFWVSIDLQVE